MKEINLKERTLSTDGVIMSFHPDYKFMHEGSDVLRGLCAADYAKALKVAARQKARAGAGAGYAELLKVYCKDDLELSLLGSEQHLSWLGSREDLAYFIEKTIEVNHLDSNPGLIGAVKSMNNLFQSDLVFTGVLYAG